jgi:hypothetical protein
VSVSNIIHMVSLCLFMRVGSLLPYLTLFKSLDDRCSVYVDLVRFGASITCTLRIMGQL